MANNVFGTSITNATLKELPEFRYRQPTQLDRARKAFETKNAYGKDANARKMAEHMRDRFPQDVATLVLIYNATGSTLKFVREYEWEGHICESPYPPFIANGQWGVFVHGKYKERANVSKAAVVYSGKNKSGVQKGWCLGWGNNRGVGTIDDQNSVYAEVRDVGHYDNSNEVKEAIRKLIDVEYKKRVSYFAENEHGGSIYSTTGDDKVAIVEAIFTIPDATSSLDE